MLKSCQYCGRIHDKKYDCGKRPIRINKKTDKDRFRYTSAWQNKRDEIKSLDNYMCQICIRNLYNTYKKINTESLEVHHALKLNEHYELRLKNTNLITLCTTHHKMADSNEIPYEVIQNIINEQRHPPEVEDLIF